MVYFLVFISTLVLQMDELPAPIGALLRRDGEPGWGREPWALASTCPTPGRRRAWEPCERPYEPSETGVASAAVGRTTRDPEP